MTKPMREIQDQINLYMLRRMQGHTYVLHDGPIEPYEPWGGAPDLSMVIWVAAKYCPATPTWSLPDVSYSAPVVLDPSEAFVQGMQRAYAEHLAREMREYIEGVLSAPEPRTMLDLITPRYSGK